MDNYSGLLDEIVSLFQDRLGSNLVGIYLHGSLAMGGFNPLGSDIDFLVISKNHLLPEIKEDLGDGLVKLSKKAPPKGLEMSVVTMGALKDFEYPTPFELHFSQDHLQAFVQGKVDFNIKRADPDLAAHFTIALQRGIVLYGPPLNSLIAEVPKEYYLKSILYDAYELDQVIGKDPVYAILNLCRVLAYVLEELITSKEEGGKWAIAHLPQYKEIITKALSIYKNANTTTEWNNEELSQFATKMIEKIKTSVKSRTNE